MKVIHISAICVLCLYIDRIQCICEVPPAEDVVGGSIPKENPEPESLVGYPSTKIGRFIQQNQLEDEISEAAKSLKFCAARSEKPEIPNLPSQLKAYDTCEVADYTITIPDQVIMGAAKCWVLKPWAGEICAYVKCNGPTDDCQGVPPSNVVPVPDKFKCRPVNPRLVKVYAFCVEVDGYNHNQYSMKSFTIRLPQCCSCIRFQCQAKGK